MDYNIASVLKQLRKTSKLPASEVTEKLEHYGISISIKTLYGYESGLSMPNADVFVSLCKIYNCDNPLDILGDSSVTPSEVHLIKKYRALDDHGREMVDFTLEKEYERSIALQDKDNVIPYQIKEPKPDYLMVNAAHALDGASEKDKQFDDDIMDDENF